MRIIRWFWLWGLQGVKLFLFSAIALAAASALCYPGYRLWECYPGGWEDLSTPEHWSHIPIVVISALLWFPIFGAAFAALLENYPVPRVESLWGGRREKAESELCASENE